MMIFAFFAVLSYSKYASIDLGSQYIRISVSSISTELTMALNSQHKILTPSAVAFKMQEIPKKRHLTIEEGFNSTLKVGDEAIKYLKYHPDSGTDRVSYFLGRYMFTDNSEILNSSPPPVIANTTEMLSLILTKLFMDHQYAGLEGISVALPRYYTLSQRESLTQSMYLARLPFFGIYDDDTAIIQLYYVKFSKKFLKLSKSKKINVLFVDIGASGIRSYRVEFYSYKSQPAANQTSYVWSENTGGFVFNSKLAKLLKITENKAQKKLINQKIEPEAVKKYLKDEIQEITRVIKEACNGEINEVQIFGSASRYSFVQEAIQNIFSNSTSKINQKSDKINFIKKKFFGNNEIDSEENQKYFNKDIPVLRDLPASEAVARGSLYYLHALLNQSQYKIVETSKVPIYTTSIECGGVLEDYCTRNKKCSDYIILHSTICEKLIFIATDETENNSENPSDSTNSQQSFISKKNHNKNFLPYGCGQIIGQFSLTNISSFSYDLTDDLNGFLALDSPSPSILSAVWCSKSTKQDDNTDEFDEMRRILNQAKNSGNDDEEKCQEIESKPTPLTDLTNKAKYDFVQLVLSGDDEKKMIGGLKSRIDSMLRGIKTVTTVGVKNEPNEEFDEMVKTAEFLIENGGSVKEMRECVKKLEKYCKLFGISI